LSDVLSQSEIDALLQALSSGEVAPDIIDNAKEEDKIKVYDFKRPDKFSKEQIRTLEMLHENFARLVTTYLSAQLRTRVNMEVASVEQLTYDEFTRSMPNPTLLAVFAAEPLPGNAILEMNPDVTFPIIDRLFGGKGQPTSDNRGLTDIEQGVLKQIIKRILGYLAESWQNVVKFKPELELIELNPQFLQIVPPGDMVILITLRTRIGNVDGYLHICLPYVSLENVVSKLNARYWFANASKTTSSESVSFLQQCLENTKVLIKVQLGKAELSVKDVLNLQVGDAIMLKRKKDDPLEVIIGDNVKFLARPGVLGSRIAVQIQTAIKEGEEMLDG